MDSTLSDYIKMNGLLSEKETAIIMKHLATGLSFIHSKGFVHLDLKSDNVLLK